MSDESNIQFIMNRAEKLSNHDYWLESFILKCFLFEDILLSLRNVLEENLCNFVKEKTSIKLNLVKYRKKELEKMTMGNLKDVLLVYDIFGKDLDEDILFFIELRNRCVHGLINKDLNEIEREIKDNQKRFDNLLDKLIKKYIPLSKEHFSFLKKKNELFKKILKTKNDKKDIQKTFIKELLDNYRV